MTRIRVLFLLGMAAVFVSAGCSTAPMKLQAINYGEGAVEQPNAPSLPDGCKVRIASVQDRRAAPSDLGDLGKPVQAEFDIKGWIAEGLRSLEKKTGSSLSTPEATTIDLDAELRNAYIRGVATSKATNIVLTVKYSLKDRPLSEKNYRGQVTCINWIGSEGEIKDSFNEALAQIVQSVAVDVSVLCNTAGDQTLHSKQTISKGE